MKTLSKNGLTYMCFLPDQSILEPISLTEFPNPNLIGQSYIQTNTGMQTLTIEQLGNSHALSETMPSFRWWEFFCLSSSFMHIS